MNYDILGLAETHLCNDDIIDLDDFKWFGNNRKNLHINAPSGSGGVGFLVKNELLDFYNIEVVDRNSEGILWLKFSDKFSDFLFYSCVCYLPPINSSRQIDASNFYDTLLSNIYIYQNDGPIHICGDFNSRIGDNSDFIIGVDNLPERNIVDFTSNAYGDKLLDFLVDSNMCILNCRNCVNNDYTSISTKGVAVVDYCIVPHDNLNLFKDFKVIRSTELISEVSRISGLVPISTPDHSVLSWCVDFASFVNDDNTQCVQNVHGTVEYDKFDLKNIPNFFFKYK